MESRTGQREAYLRRRRERRRRVTLRWFVLIGCIVVIVFAALIWTDSCEGSRGGDAGVSRVAAAVGHPVAADSVGDLGGISGAGRRAATTALGAGS